MYHISFTAKVVPMLHGFFWISPPAQREPIKSSHSTGIMAIMRYSTENDVRLDWNGFDEMLTGDDEMLTLK
jgi:hypothetical protein